MFEKSHIIKLTVFLYKVSDFFPVNEPLRIIIREKANEILADLILAEKDKNKPIKIIDEIEVLLAYLQVAKAQDWAKQEHLDILESKYSGLKKILEEGLQDKKKEKPVFVSSNVGTTAGKVDLGKKRLNDIVAILKKQEAVQVKDIKESFPNLSKRTLRRDFEYLLLKGVVERIGDNNNTLYKLKIR